MTQLVTVTGRYGKYVVNPEDHFVGQSIIQYGEYCQQEVDFLNLFIKDDWIVCDVGANVGALTLAFARKARHVYAYEPHPFMFGALQQVVELNKLPNVTPIRAAIGVDCGIVGFQDLEQRSYEHNNGAHAIVPFKDNEHAVNMVNFIYDCDLLKVDVEGMELDVLKASTPMIKKNNTILFVENDRPDKSYALVEYIQNTLNYKMWWCPWTLYHPDNFKKNTVNVYGDMGCVNMICAPNRPEIDIPYLQRVVLEDQPKHGAS